MSGERRLPRALPPGDSVTEVHHLRLEPLPWLVAVARTFVDEHAPPLPPDTRDALLLLTSELVTNAVLHGRSPLEVGITVTQESVLVTVHDLDQARPAPQPYVPREGGWGLGLVAALADESALERHLDGGKTAWFRLSRDRRSPPPDDAARRGVPREFAGW